MSADDLFDQVYDLPDPAAQRRLANLVGLDEKAETVVKEAMILLNPGALREWSDKQYKVQLPIVAHFMDRHALLVFSGDVGTGKTELAETVGDRLAREAKVDVKVYCLSLKTRGWGGVGQMTSLLTEAFEFVRHQAETWTDSKVAGILIIDEADSLAQSRELGQMHHEDRAGVNALIRGIDSLTNSRVPVVTLMCTNRVEAIDPAVRRRAARVFEFTRPNLDQRKVVLGTALTGVGFTDGEIEELGKETGERDDRQYGYTFSDLRQRLLPSMVLDAFPDAPLTFQRALELAKNTEPTPPFGAKRTDEI